MHTQPSSPKFSGPWPSCRSCQDRRVNPVLTLFYVQRNVDRPPISQLARSRVFRQNVKRVCADAVKGQQDVLSRGQRPRSRRTIALKPYTKSCISWLTVNAVVNLKITLASKLDSQCVYSITSSNMTLHRQRHIYNWCCLPCSSSSTLISLCCKLSVQKHHHFLVQMSHLAGRQACGSQPSCHCGH